MGGRHWDLCVRLAAASQRHMGDVFLLVDVSSAHIGADGDLALPVGMGLYSGELLGSWANGGAYGDILGQRCLFTWSWMGNPLNSSVPGGRRSRPGPEVPAVSAGFGVGAVNNSWTGLLVLSRTVAQRNSSSHGINTLQGPGRHVGSELGLPGARCMVDRLQPLLSTILHPSFHPCSTLPIPVPAPTKPHRPRVILPSQGLGLWV